MNDTYCKRVGNEIILRGFHKKGEIALCCKSLHPFSMDTDISEINEVKTALDNGIYHKHCNYCWKLEHNGQKSWRQTGNEMPDDAKKNVEIYLDNTCDLACVYCTPKYSSSWIQEIASANKKNIPIQSFINDDYYDKQKETYNHIPKILSFIEQLGKEAKNSKPLFISMLGGEPLLTSAVKKDVIGSIITAFYKHADDNEYLGIQIVTNGNTPDAIIDKTLNKINQLQDKHPQLRVSVNLSTESIGKAAEFIRYGLDWKQFEKNCNKWLNAPGIDVSWSMAVNMISWKFTPEFLVWAIKKAREYNKKTHFNFNTVDYPQHMSIKMLPPSDYQIFNTIKNICEKNKSIFTNLYLYEKTMMQIESAKTDFSNLHEADIEIKKALKYLDYMKKHRNKDINDINPELLTHLQMADKQHG